MGERKQIDDMDMELNVKEGMMIQKETWEGGYTDCNGQGELMLHREIWERCIELERRLDRRRGVTLRDVHREMVLHKEFT